MKKQALVVFTIFCGAVLAAQIHDNPFAVKADPDATVTYTNPVIAGFYSDPSVCRAGEDYYLVTSSFEYFSAVPIFHSRDLVNWRQIGHCIDRREQLPEGVNIFACTLRYHDGTFYLITTNVGKGGNFYMTARDPAGPWGDPIWIRVGGIDPDLFFDDDGKVYVTTSEFVLYEMDIRTGKLLSEGRKIWWGTGGRYAEGPHLYKKDGYYYLMAAEGGTEEAHSETIARSNCIRGPYTEYKANPILAHANAAGQNSPIQGVGHADMLQAHDGSWWMVFHGYRKVVGYPSHHILGRETCLAPVVWPRYGWPVVNGNGTVSTAMTCSTLPLKPWPKQAVRDEFEGEKLRPEWNFIQIPQPGQAFCRLKDGTLSLKVSPRQIGDGDCPSFVGRRLQHHDFTASAAMQFDPENENEEAGMVLLNNGQHFDLLVKRSGPERVAFVKLQFGSTVYRSTEMTVKPGPVTLQIRGTGGRFVFACSQGGQWREIERADARYLSTETVGGFTGVYVGLYATGRGTDSDREAVFDYFEYSGRLK